MNEIKNAKRTFLENKKKNILPECALSHILKKDCISHQDALYIYQESEKLMPILLIQYKTDLNMICLKMKGYQKLLREECIRKNNDKLEVIISK